MSGLKAAAAGLTAVFALGLAGAGSAQQASSPTPPSPEALARCAQLPSDDARLSCYDAAMRAAGYGPKPAEVAEERRKGFGLSLPKLGLLKHHDAEEGQAAADQGGAAAPPPAESPNRETVKVSEVALVQPDSRMLVVTDDGQIWEQTDTTQVSSVPLQGGSMNIRKGALDGYFCSANKYQEVRCKRVR